MPEKNYFAKIIILCLATLAGIFAIWYALIREQSVDWISAQVLHQVSPYVVNEVAGRVMIENVVSGYEFSLPPGFRTAGARNLSFFMIEGKGKKCEIKHYYFRAEKAGKLSVGPGRRIMPWRQGKLIFELAEQKEVSDCTRYLLEIKSLDAE